MNKIFVFGNPDLPEDSLPLLILPELRVKFPDIKFEFIDPNEEWNVTGDIIAIDTVVGINEVKIFENLEKFSTAPRVSMHDFDALANLRFLKKLGKIDKVKVIGIPQDISKEKAIIETSEAITSMFVKE